MKALSAELFTAVPLERDRERKKGKVAPCKHAAAHTLQDGCGSGGRAGHPFTRRLVVRSSAPLVCMLKSPWATH